VTLLRYQCYCFLLKIVWILFVSTFSHFYTSIVGYYLLLMCPANSTTTYAGGLCGWMLRLLFLLYFGRFSIKHFLDK
ncbi:MAG: hypothetical protein ACI94Z_001608, partial [Yoonia sp.]